MKKLVKSCCWLMTVILCAFSINTVSFAAETKNVWTKEADMSGARGFFQSAVIDGKIYVVGGTRGDNSPITSVEMYDPKTNKWTTKASMLTPRASFQMEVIDGKLYAIGGDQSQSSTTSSVEEYNPETNTWVRKASMLTPRAFLQTEVINGKIYAIGGFNKNASKLEDQFLASTEVYNPATNRWTQLASMKAYRYSFSTSIINDKIYAIGSQPYIEEFDPATNKWALKVSTPDNKASAQTPVINGKIYNIGGGSSSVGEYDPITNIYTIKKAGSVKRQGLETEEINGKIYAIGGGNTSVEIYSPEKDSWTEIAPMNEKREYFQTVVLNNVIYAIGGNRQPSIEAYNVAEIQSPTLTVTASPNKVKVGNPFTTTVAVHNGTNICAEDIKIKYNPDLFEYVGADAKDGLKIYKEDKSTPGEIRFIVASQGKANAATGDKDLITLNFKAKKLGQGKVDIVKGRIADNATLEMDVDEANCGEDTITVESTKDVNRSGEYTLLDLGIDGWYYGDDAANTDTTKYDTDVVVDGKIDDSDLSEIAKQILANSNYGPNN